MNIPRMRTVPEAATEIKALDEHTALTECAIRRLVLEGKIKSVKAGRKHLINFDQLINYLNNPLPEEDHEEEPAQNATIIPLERMEAYKRNIGMK